MRGEPHRFLARNYNRLDFQFLPNKYFWRQNITTNRWCCFLSLLAWTQAWIFCVGDTSTAIYLAIYHGITILFWIFYSCNIFELKGGLKVMRVFGQALLPFAPSSTFALLEFQICLVRQKHRLYLLKQACHDNPSLPFRPCLITVFIIVLLLPKTINSLKTRPCSN